MNTSILKSAPIWHQASVGLALSIIDLMTIVGSCLVITAVATTKRLQTVTNQYVVSLAFSDLLVSLLVLPLGVVYQLSGRWMFSATLCKVWVSLDILLCTSSILNLCCISVDRYLAITKPLIYATRRSKKLARIMIAVVWVLSSILTIPPLLGWSQHIWGNGECIISLHKGYRLYTFMGSFFIPFLVMLFVYCSIFWVAYRRLEMMGPRRRPNSPSISLDTRRSVAGNKSSPGTAEFSVTATPVFSRSFCCLCHRCHPRRSNHHYDDDSSESSTTYSNWQSNRFQPDNIMKKPDRITALQQLLYDSRVIASIIAIPLNCFQYMHQQPAQVRHVRFLDRDRTRKNERTAFRREHKTAKTLAVVVGCFSACWLPFFIVYLLESFCSCAVSPLVLSVVTWLGYINSVFNPFIYAFYNKEYAAAFSRLLCR